MSIWMALVMAFTIGFALGGIICSKAAITSYDRAFRRRLGLGSSKGEH